jgi:hypothetical protein
LGGPGTVTSLTFLQAIAHAAPAMAFDPVGGNFTIWSTFDSNYNQ